MRRPLGDERKEIPPGGRCSAAQMCRTISLSSPTNKATLSLLYSLARLTNER